VCVPEPLAYCAKIIAGPEAALVWVVFDVRLPAARVPGRDRLTQARRLVVVAAAAVVVDAAGARTAAPAELDRPAAAFFLVGRALHLYVLRRPEARHFPWNWLPA